MSYGDLGDFPKHGDVYGEPNPGHRSDTLWAAVLIMPNGDEGLVSHWQFNSDGDPTGRTTFVTSDPQALPLLKQMIARAAVGPGVRIEWREYKLVK